MILIFSKENILQWNIDVDAKQIIPDTICKENSTHQFRITSKQVKTLIYNILDL